MVSILRRNTDNNYIIKDLVTFTKKQLEYFYVRIVKAMVFPVVIYERESWALMKSERRRVDALDRNAGDNCQECPVLSGDPTSQFLQKLIGP